MPYPAPPSHSSLQTSLGVALENTSGVSTDQGPTETHLLCSRACHSRMLLSVILEVRLPFPTLWATFRTQLQCQLSSGSHPLLKSPHIHRCLDPKCVINTHSCLPLCSASSLRTETLYVPMLGDTLAGVCWMNKCSQDIVKSLCSMCGKFCGEGYKRSTL